MLRTFSHKSCKKKKEKNTKKQENPNLCSALSPKSAVLAKKKMFKQGTP